MKIEELKMAIAHCRLILHPYHFRSFLLFVFFLVEPGAMVFGLDDGGSAGGVLATRGENQQDEENVQGEFSHAMITAKIVLFA